MITTDQNSIISTAQPISYSSSQMALTEQPSNSRLKQGDLAWHWQSARPAGHFQAAHVAKLVAFRDVGVVPRDGLVEDGPWCAQPVSFRCGGSRGFVDGGDDMIRCRSRTTREPRSCGGRAFPVAEQIDAVLYFLESTSYTSPDAVSRTRDLKS